MAEHCINRYINDIILKQKIYIATLIMRISVIKGISFQVLDEAL